MNNKIVSCSPGKVILHGEHAVVYGKSAIALSVDLTTKVEINVIDNGNDVTLNLLNFNATTSWLISDLQQLKLIDSNHGFNKVLNFDEKLTEIIQHLIEAKNLSKEIVSAYNAFLLLYLSISDSYCQSNRKAMEVSVSSAIPCGAGLGSSSSYTVALTAALLRAYQLDENLSLISEWAFQIDKLFHGKPSGIDNSICTYGGSLLFRSGKIVEQLSNAHSLPVIIVYTGVQRNTKAMVQKVKQLYDQFPNIVSNIMNAIDEISLTSWQLLTQQNTSFELLSKLFRTNQHLLNSLGVGHSAIDDIVKCAEKHGLSAKLTGAGGGGTVVILNTAPNKDIIENFYKELNQFGFQYWEVFLGSGGVLLK